jgi:hypothetical protein
MADSHVRGAERAGQTLGQRSSRDQWAGAGVLVEHETWAQKIVDALRETDVRWAPKAVIAFWCILTDLPRHEQRG